MTFPNKDIWIKVSSYPFSLLFASSIQCFPEMFDTIRAFTVTKKKDPWFLSF